jgi:hypothetical protein
VPKFRVVKVALFRYKDKTYATEETVELSEADTKRLTPCDYLKSISKLKKTHEPVNVRKNRLNKNASLSASL